MELKIPQGCVMMKKILLGYLIGAMTTLILLLSTTTFAEDGLEKISAYLRTGLPITLDGKIVKLESPAITYEGSTYLKLRDAAKLTGVGVKYNANTGTVELSTESAVIPSSTDGNIEVTPVNDGGETMTTEQPTDLVVLDNYFDDKSQGALKVNDIIYVTIRGGSDKYKIYDSTWNIETMSLVFTEEKVTVYISNNVGVGDGFTYKGSVYIKESIFSNMANAQ
jgi:hypothetical protein